MMVLPPLAVHISDGVLVWPWLLLGFVGTACLLFWSSRRIADDEIPRIGLLTAAFFVASLIHVRVGPTSVHLLLSGLVGIVLGVRAVLAIAVGLVLQAILLGHGGFTALGVNCCIMAVPALLSRPLFCWLAAQSGSASFRFRDGLLAVAYILSPMLMLPLAIGAFIVIRSGPQFTGDRDFRAGFLVGITSVMLTAFLNAAVLVVAGVEDWRLIAALVLAAHIPIAFIEALIVGCTASFLRRVKPKMLGKSEMG